MKNPTRFTLSLFAAALLTAATAAHAISVGATIDATTQAASDTALISSVEAKLAADARLSGSHISVSTENGLAVLSGTAPSMQAKAVAEELAKSSNPDAKVINHIEAPGVMSTLKADAKVAADTTGEVITDTWISAKIKSQLLADTATKGTSIRVRTRDNVVSLKGTVASQAEKDQAIKLAGETKGVLRVNARKLKVSTKADVSANTQ